MKLLLTFLNFVIFSASVRLPSNFKKCNRHNPNFDECLLDATKDAFPQLTRSYEEINFEHMNPIYLTEATITGGNGRVALEQKYKNCELYGVPQMKLDKIKFDFDGKNLYIGGIIPELRKECDYEIKGQILFIPVNGRGKSTITMKNLHISSLLQYEEIEKKGETYLKFAKNRVTLDPEFVHFNFENAIDRTISDGTNQALNDNWKEVFDDVKGGFEEIVSQIILKMTNGIFSKVSSQEMFD